MGQDHVPGPQALRWTGYLRRAQQGEPHQFGRLAAEMEPWLRGRLRRCAATAALFRDREDVRDALQEAFLRAWRALHAYDSARGSAGAWVWAIARNCAVEFLRRRRRRALSFDERRDSPLEGPGPDRPDGAAAEAARAVRHVLDRALAARKRDVRRAWDCRFDRGMTYAEIARELGVPPGTVATWIHRVKAAVRKAGPPTPESARHAEHA
jgi:RNA polymerase sigma-70 factor (ECF subfamily)